MAEDSAPVDAPDCPGCQDAMLWVAETWYCAHCDISIRPEQHPQPPVAAPS